MVTEINIEGGGRDSIELERLDKDTFLLRIWRTNRSTGERVCDENKVYRPEIETLWNLIRNRLDTENAVGARYMYRMVIEHYKFNEGLKIPMEFFLDAFNGGRNRTKFYFPFYYHPVKCLQKTGYISYCKSTGAGRGAVKRIKPAWQLWEKV